MPKHIAFVGNSAATMYNFRGELIKDLLKRGFKVTVITPKDKDISCYTSLGARFIEIEVDCRGRKPIKDIKLYRALKKIYSEEQFDYIFHYTIKPVIYGSFAAKNICKSSYSVITGLGYSFMKADTLNRVVCFLYRHTLKYSKQVWFLNQEDKNLFLNKHLVESNKIIVINGEGVNSEYFKRSKNSSKVYDFIFISRILWGKGVQVLIDAVRELKLKNPLLKVGFLGPIDENDALSVTSNDLKSWEQEGLINYLGVTDDVRPYIEESDCVVLPSYYREGLPRILLESASMEKPIITTDHIGCRDIVKDGVNGLLCTPNNTESLLNCMEKMLLMTEQEKQEMGKKGREMVLNLFDQQIITKVYLDTLS